MEDNEFEPIELIMNEIESLPDDKLAMFFLNLFSSEGLIEMAQDIIESRLSDDVYEIESAQDAKDFVKSYL